MAHSAWQHTPLFVSQVPLRHPVDVVHGCPPAAWATHALVV
jgi:hypothetical protein